MKIRRIIPTRVGTSFFYVIYRSVVRDHPHACGDKYGSVFGYKDGKGSSPRVWGQGLYSLIRVSVLGIIPTRVGTSVVYARSGRVLEDHPHACGDKS